jgi:hypothetical protein
VVGAVVALGLLALWLIPARDPRPEQPPSIADRPAPDPGLAPADAPAEEKPTVTEVTTSRLGVTVQLVKRPRLRPKPPFGPAYAELEPAARAGDVDAQYALGLLLYECRELPADSAMLEQQIDQMHQTHSRDGWDVGNPAMEEQALRSRFADCAGVPTQARGEYRDWLKRAADAGLVEAQVDLPLRLPPGRWCQYLSDCSAEQRAQHEAMQQEALDYTGRARDAGSAEALWTFGAWYAEGEVLPQDDVEAYAHFLALDEIGAAAGEQRFERMLDSLGPRLRPVDLDRAEARARELLANPKCCVVTP